jgi:hypothetical protein
MIVGDCPHPNGQTPPARVVVVVDFFLSSKFSRWHLVQVDFSVPAGATRPIFLEAVRIVHASVRPRIQRICEGPAQIEDPVAGYRYLIDSVDGIGYRLPLEVRTPRLRTPKAKSRPA